MREPSVYMSDIFISVIWNGFCERADYTERTKSEYFYVLISACNFAKCDFHEIDYGAARAFYDYLIGKMQSGELSRNTVSFKIHALMTVAKYIQNDLDDSFPDYRNPFIKLPAIPVSTAIPRETLPSMEVLDKIMSACDQKLYVIMSLSLKCGLATSEVLRLKREQFRVIDGANYIYIPAASVKKESRYVKVPDDVYQIYIDYLGSDPETDDAGHLFLNKRGNVMRINNIETALANAEKAAGIEGHFTLKDLRNRAVLSMLKASNDPAGVAAQVGIRGLRMESFIRSAGMFDNNKAPGDLINFKIQPFGSTHESG